MAFVDRAQAVVIKLAIYLRGFFLAYESLEDCSAELRFIGGITHSAKFRSTRDGAAPHRFRLLLPLGDEVSSVIIQKTARRIVREVRHLGLFPALV